MQTETKLETVTLGDVLQRGENTKMEKQLTIAINPDTTQLETTTITNKKKFLIHHQL